MQFETPYYCSEITALLLMGAVQSAVAEQDSLIICVPWRKMMSKPIAVCVVT